MKKSFMTVMLIILVAAVSFIVWIVAEAIQALV